MPNLSSLSIIAPLSLLFDMTIKSDRQWLAYSPAPFIHSFSVHCHPERTEWTWPNWTHTLIDRHTRREAAPHLVAATFLPLFLHFSGSFSISFSLPIFSIAIESVVGSGKETERRGTKWQGKTGEETLPPATTSFSSIYGWCTGDCGLCNHMPHSVRCRWSSSSSVLNDVGTSFSFPSLNLKLICSIAKLKGHRENETVTMGR